MARTKQVNRKCKGSQRPSKEKAGDTARNNRRHRKNINCNKFFNKFKFERSQTEVPLLPRATIARCMSPFLRTNGQSDIIIGFHLRLILLLFQNFTQASF